MPPTFPYPGDAFLIETQRAVSERYARAGHPLDLENTVWTARTAYDSAFMPADQARAKHLRELERALGLEVPPPPARDPIVGQLRIEGGLYVDDRGPILPTFLHAGDLFALYVREPAVALQELDDMADAGYHGPRVWTHLSGDYWRRKDREVSGEDRFDALEAFSAELTARQLLPVWSQGDVGAIRDRRRFMERLATLPAAFCDAGNEAWQTGEADPQQLATMMRWYRDAGGRGIRSLTSPPGEEQHELDAYSIDPAQVFDVHGYRGGHWYDKARHIFSIPWEVRPLRRLGIQSEHTGPGELVTVTDNPHELDDEAMGLFAAQSLTFRQAYIYFCGDGIWRRQPIKANAGYAAVARAKTYLPRDVMRFGMTHGYHDKPTRVFTVPNDAMRCDHAIADDGRFVATLYGPGPDRAFPIHRSFTGSLIDPGTGEATPLQARAGEHVHIPFRRGRVVVGQLA
ncbi:MAG TPA: hypothetical protein VEC57_15040 [Candidatus Limnocylindrales bacterium]|nr:hypothetical protein [Candidatus Limnocylindrales bacterium]